METIKLKEPSKKNMNKMKKRKFHKIKLQQKIRKGHKKDKDKIKNSFKKVTKKYMKY